MSSQSRTDVQPGAGYLTEADFLPFQRRWLKATFAEGIDTSILSLPRGAGKTSLVSFALARALTPGDALFAPRSKCVLLAASIKQAREAFDCVRAALEDSPRRKEYRFADSQQTVGILHKPSRSSLDVRSRSGKTLLGLKSTRILVLDEPGSLETRNGELLYAAIDGAIGKVGSELKVILCGTIAPGEAGWWGDLCLGPPRPRTHRLVVQGNRAKWDDLAELRKIHPVKRRDKYAWEVLKGKRNAARNDTRLKADFLSWHLNLPTRDESQTLLNLDEWDACAARPVAPRHGAPIVGLDLGANRSWSAAVAIWSGPEGIRLEACAVAPGEPDLGAQEKRDAVGNRTYQDLAVRSNLIVDAGRRVVRPAKLVDYMGQFGRPRAVVCDRFRLEELRDCSAGLPLRPRVTRWSEAAADIRDFRRLVLDCGLTVEPRSALLLSAAVAVAQVENDASGNVRMVKRGSNNKARDDVAAAAVLAAGALGRLQRAGERRQVRVIPGGTR